MFEPASKSKDYVMEVGRITNKEFNGRRPGLGYYKDSFPLEFVDQGVHFTMHMPRPVTHEDPYTLVCTNRATKEKTAIPLHTFINPMIGYGGNMGGHKHLFLMGSMCNDPIIGFHRVGFLFVDSREGTFNFVTKPAYKMYYRAHFTTDGRIVAFPNYEETIHIYDNTGLVQLGVKDIPKKYKGSSLYRTLGSDFSFAQDLFFFRLPRKIGSVELAIFDPFKQIFVGLIKPSPQGHYDAQLNIMAKADGSVWAFDALQVINPMSQESIPAIAVKPVDKAHIIFALIVSLADGYYTIPVTKTRSPKRDAEDAERRQKAHKFFKITQRLPMEIQAILANKLGNNPHSHIISGKDFNKLTAHNYL